MPNSWKLVLAVLALSLLVASSVSVKVAASERGDLTLTEHLAAHRASHNNQNKFTQLFTTAPDADQNASEALKALREDAEQGDPNAQYLLGLVYNSGAGAPQDFAAAATWYRKAADKGHAGAQFYLGLLYASGRGVPPDLVQAHMWLSLAAASEPGARKVRDELTAKMTRSQIDEASRLAREWRPK
jgi:TPR repeat protein